MAELRLPTAWMPWPRRLRPGRARRWTALALLLVALAGVAWTLVVWRADAADRHNDFARAVWWRPDVALYRRHWGEALLLVSPERAEMQLLAAVRLDPYDPLAIADLTSAELALGNWPRAVAANQPARRTRPPDFYTYWRLANLFLSHGDMGGYWQQTRLAAALAPAADFASIVSRSLTASDADFTALRRALPDGSIAAASAYLAAAAQAGNLEAVNEAVAWLQALPAPATPGLAAQRRQAMRELVLTAWRRWPQDAAHLDQAAVALDAIPAPAKGAAAPFILNPAFTPAAFVAARQAAPDPGSDISALVDWQLASTSGIQLHSVETGDAAHPTAADIGLDSFQPDDAAIAQQWFLAPGGASLTLSVTGRQLQNQPQQGMQLRVSDFDNHVIATLPLALTTVWQDFSRRVALPGSGVQAWRLQLHYQRPRGQMPMNNHVLLTAVGLQ